jgi:hypothetical protein
MVLLVVRRVWVGRLVIEEQAAVVWQELRSAPPAMAL